jgi:hypothetical protein
LPIEQCVPDTLNVVAPEPDPPVVVTTTVEPVAFVSVVFEILNVV